MNNLPELAPLSTCRAGTYEIIYANGDKATRQLTAVALYELVNNMPDYLVVSVTAISND